MSQLLKVQQSERVLLTTVDRVEGLPAMQCFGAVTGQGILGANFVKDFIAHMHDTLGGSVSEYEEVMDDAMTRALQSMARKAKEYGANAVVGIRMQTGVYGERGMLFASCIGTAVKVDMD